MTMSPIPPLRSEPEAGPSPPCARIVFGPRTGGPSHHAGVAPPGTVTTKQAPPVGAAPPSRRPHGTPQAAGDRQAEALPNTAAGGVAPPHPVEGPLRGDLVEPGTVVGDPDDRRASRFAGSDLHRHPARPGMLHGVVEELPTTWASRPGSTVARAEGSPSVVTATSRAAARPRHASITGQRLAPIWWEPLLL
jgi:hypothetical protein